MTIKRTLPFPSLVPGAARTMLLLGEQIVLDELDGGRFAFHTTRRREPRPDAHPLTADELETVELIRARGYVVED